MIRRIFWNLRASFFGADSEMASIGRNTSICSHSITIRQIIINYGIQGLHIMMNMMEMQMKVPSIRATDLLINPHYQYQIFHIHMQIPNNNNQYYAYPVLPNQPSGNMYNQAQNPYNQQQQQYPYNQQQMNYQYPQQYPMMQAQYVQPKPKLVKKPCPFSFEPGSDKDLDDAMKSIGNMYNTMFDSVEVQREREKQEEQEQVVMGVPIMQWNPYNNDNKQL